MYRSFYQLSHKPFHISTDPRFLWLGESHKEALANLTYGLREGNDFLVLTGGVGTGKTTLVNALLASLTDSVRVANITHPKLDPTEFLGLVLRTFDPSAALSGRIEMLLLFEAFLRRTHAEGKRALLVVDEAHRLSMDLLEEIRLWSNIEHAGTRLINVFFVGQSELKATLSSSACLALRQRITLFYHLHPLSNQEVEHYVAHRLKVAGAARQLFTPAALNKIYKVSNGCPRRINIVCDRALLTGYVKALAVIDADTVMECAREINALDPKVPLLKKIVHAGAYRRLQLSWATMAARAAGAKKRFMDGCVRLKTVGGRLVESARSRIAPVKRTIPERYHRFPAIRRGAILIGGLIAGALILFSFWSDGLQDRANSATPSQQTATGGIDEVEADIQDRSDRPELSMASEANISRSIAPAPPYAQADAQRGDSAAARPPRIEGPSTLELAKAALDQKDFHTAIELLEADPNTVATPSAEARVLYAEVLAGHAEQIMTQSPEKARQMISKAIAIAPDQADAYVINGKLHTFSKEYAMAIGAYRQALALDPELPDALFNLGFIYAMTGMLDDAEKMLARVVALKPPYVDKALFNLAVVQHKQGKTSESIETLESALSIRPENERARIYLRQLKEVSR